MSTRKKKESIDFAVEFAALAAECRASALADAHRHTDREVKMLRKRVDVLEKAGEETRGRLHEYRATIARYQRELAEARRALRDMKVW